MIAKLSGTSCLNNWTNYPFGFNGQEKDNEIYGEGNAYSFEFRIHDSRLGRFLSVDPLMKNYPYYTPYQYAGNTPIQAIDIEGAEELKVTDKAFAFYTKAKLVVSKSERLLALMNSISDPSKAATQKVYLAIGETYSAGALGFTYDYNIKPIVQQLVKYQNMSTEEIKNLTMEENLEKWGFEAKYVGLFDVNYGLDLNEIANSTQPEVYLIVIDENLVISDEKEGLKTLAHEVQAHLQRALKGEPGTGNDDHRKYYGIKKGSAEDRKYGLGHGDIPRGPEIKPNSEAGKNNSEIDKVYDEF